MMPKMTGLLVSAAVRGIPERKTVKILMLSAKSQTAEQKRVMAAGTDCFLAKPFRPIKLTRKGRDLLNE